MELLLQSEALCSVNDRVYLQNIMIHFFTFNKTTRKWHLPVVAGVAVGTPLLLGWYLDNLEAGKLASLAGLSILYIQSEKLAERMMMLMTCCFGFMICYAVGLLFSFNAVLAPIALGLLAFGTHYSLHKLQLTKPPGNFFFIMLASMAICTPFEIGEIPSKIGYIAMGTMFTCGLALIYSLITLKNNTLSTYNYNKDDTKNIAESIIFGIFILVSLALALALQFENPYWVPISCLAVMQGASSKHTWQRGLQRIIGTLIGLGITWLIAYSYPDSLTMVIGIIVLQVVIEYFIVRNYTLTVIFITVLTIFLAETSGQLSHETDGLFIARLIDILMGSSIGIIGGWVLYHEKVHYYATLERKKRFKQMKNHRKL